MQGRLEVDRKRDDHTMEIVNTMPEYVREWYLNLEASRKTSATRKDYINKIKKFMLSISSDLRNIDTKDITYNKVLEYYISIQHKTNPDGTQSVTSDSYQASIWSALDNFLSYLRKRKYIDENYMELIEKPKVRDIDRINEKRIRMTKDDFGKIQLAARCGAGNELARQRQEQYKERDLAILGLFMTTGMRCTALTEINIEDVDFENRQLSIIDKREKRHLYPLDDYMINVLKKWIEVRDSINYTNSDALFVTKNGRIHQGSVTKIVKKYTQEALGEGVSPHKLRAGYCTILYDETKDINFVRMAVGHSQITTTQRYIKSNNEEKLKATKMMSSILA